MTCALVRTRLDDYVDRAVPRDEIAALETHLQGCPECRLQLDWLRTLLADAAALPRSIDPESDLWPRIARGMRRPQAVGSRFGRWPPAWAAAAVLLMALSSGLTVFWMKHYQRRGADLTITRAEYERASADLAVSLDAVPSRLSPATIAAVQRGLRVIDAAIAEAEEALARDPGQHELEQMLWARYQLRIELLQRAARSAERS